MLRILFIALALASPALAGDQLLNVSYDPTRELWKAVNAKFIPAWQEKSGQALDIRQSHGGSGTQARAVVDGLEADVVTLAMWPDVDAIRRAGLIADGWERRFPNHSTPYTSTIVFLVRGGNPKGIRDWNDLARAGVEVVTPSPKTSGAGRLAFLAAWGQVLQNGGSAADAQAFVTALYRQAPVLDSGARAASVTFARKGIGDVQLTWENEAHLQLAETPGELEIVYPSVSFLAEPPVAVVDVNARRHGTSEAAEAYLAFLFSPAGQELIAQSYYRPIDPAVAARYRSRFPALRMFGIDAIARDWNDANARFFGDGQVFDSIYQPGR